MARLAAIWIKRVRRGVMDPVETAVLDTGKGLSGNANRGGRRQVTIIARERWDEMMQLLGVSLPPATRRANLLVSGVVLEHSRGKLLQIGETLLRINGETRPCEQMEAAYPGLQAVMTDRWGGGAFAEVVAGGRIHIGDEVRWKDGSAVP